MKAKSITLFVFFCYTNILLFGQCTTCYNLTEALLDPQQVKEINLNAEALKSIPGEIEKFPNLERLILSNNQLMEVSLDFSKLPKLKQLNLSNNPGLAVFSFPESFYLLPLEYLNLSGNALEALPNSIGKLTALQTLDLSRNNISSLPMELSNNKTLHTLLLSDNQLLPTPCQFCDFWSVKHLDVGENKQLFLQSLFQSLLYKDQLKSLRITNLMQDKIPADNLSKLPLEELTFSGSMISSFEGSVKQFSNLKSITFENCQLTDPAKLFKQLNQIKSLENIVFKQTDASKYLSEVKHLKKMVVQEAKLEDPKIIDELPNLETAEFIQLNSPAPVANNKIPNSSSFLPMAQDMLNNNVEPIAERPAQKFTLPADSPCEIKLENSSFEIPKNAFLSQTGEPYLGVTKVAVKEHTDPILMALEGLPMVMNENNTNELFSSNGMIEFSAVDSNNRALRPNPNALIQVTLKDLQPDQSSSLFIYDSVQRNWNRLQTPPRATNFDSIRRRFLDSLNRIEDNKFVSMNVIHLPIKLSVGKKGKDPHLVKFSYYYANNYLNRKSPSVTTYYERGFDTDYLLKQDWRMDLDLNKDWIEFLQKVKKDDFLYKNRKKRRNFANTPRPIQDLELSVNKSADNFLLDFKYKGERKQIPIYLAIEGNPEKIQRAHLNFHKKYLRLKKREDKSFKRYQQAFESQQNELAQRERERIASLLTFGVQNPASQEMLTFGLTNFGLVNCDFFSRNVPEQYIAFSDKAIDQNGKEVRVPENVSNVLVPYNTYVVTSKSRVPIFATGGGVIFFIISATEIAIVRSYEKVSSGFRAIVERISTKDLSSTEIRAKILQ